ncbi:MAG: alpha/beta fold hydrolase [Pseudorhodoplanes sp.]
MRRWHLVLALVSPMAAIALPLQAGEVAVPPFYANVMAMKPDGALGKVIAQEGVATSVPDAQAWRIAYVSSDVRERPTISTALVIAPKGATPDGGRPILAWAHGTTGTAQNCGPSQVLDPAQDLNQYFLVGGTSWTDFGVPALSEFIGKGYVVVATDYQGLGGGGRHQYAISATQARDVINSIRAAGSMGLSGQGRKAAVYGWSQGGGAALSAAGLGDYIRKTGTAFDGIDIVGFAALAPQDVAVMIPKGAVDAVAANTLLQGLAKTFSDNVFNFTHFAMMMWATPSAFPEVELSDLFSAQGVSGLNAIFEKKCMHAAADTMSFAFGDAYKSFLRQNPARPEQWVKTLLEGSVAPVKPIAPVVIYWGTKDTTVPPVMGQLYREQICGMGGNVTRVQLPGEQTHFSTPGAAQAMYVQWIADRFAGKDTPDGCRPN